MVNKQKILIVDDDNNIAELISLYLTKECFETMIVNDGESALKAVDSFAPNLMLLDLMLPALTDIRSVGKYAPTLPSQSSCSPQRARSSTKYLVWNSVQMTTWKSRSIPRNWWPASRQFCAVINPQFQNQRTPILRAWNTRI